MQSAFTVVVKVVNQANSGTNRVSEQGAFTSRIKGDGDNSPVSSTSSLITSTNAQPVILSEFYSPKESDQSKHFNRNKDGKK